MIKTLCVHEFGGVLVEFDWQFEDIAELTLDCSQATKEFGNNSEFELILINNICKGEVSRGTLSIYCKSSIADNANEDNANERYLSYSVMPGIIVYTKNLRCGKALLSDPLCGKYIQKTVDYTIQHAQTQFNLNDTGLI
jgi:hypothetical protein